MGFAHEFGDVTQPPTSSAVCGLLPVAGFTHVSQILKTHLQAPAYALLCHVSECSMLPDGHPGACTHVAIAVTRCHIGNCRETFPFLPFPFSNTETYRTDIILMTLTSGALGYPSSSLSLLFSCLPSAPCAPALTFGSASLFGRVRVLPGWREVVRATSHGQDVFS